MTLLAATNYDPGTAATASSASNLAMTAIDTTNLRLSFVAPSSGSVLVRLKTITHGSSSYPMIHLGVLDGSTVMGRQAGLWGLQGVYVSHEAMFVVTGLNAGQTYTWDAAYGVETAVASTAIKFGGPNNTTVQDAFGGFVFEIYSADGLLGGKLYDPASAVSKATSSRIAMTALDTTNLRLTFTAPGSGAVFVRLRGLVHGTTTYPTILLGVLDGATIKGRSAPVGALLGTALTTTFVPQESGFIVSGLTPGTSYTWDAAYGVEILVASSNLKYGGPNDTTSDNAFGGFTYEIWDADYAPIPFGQLGTGRTPRHPGINFQNPGFF